MHLHISLNGCHQVLVDVHIGDQASPKIYSVLMKIELLQLHVVHGGMNPSNCEIAKNKAQFTTKMFLNLFDYWISLSTVRTLIIAIFQQYYRSGRSSLNMISTTINR